MPSLKYGSRDISLKYDKRAVCPVDVTYRLIEEAINEGIQMYAIVFAYDLKLYQIGYYKENNKIVYNIGLCDDVNSSKYNILDELKNNMNYIHDVTIVREFQSGELKNPIEVDIRNNYILKDYLIDQNNEKYNMNFDEKLVLLFNELTASANKDSKTTTIFLVFCVIIVIIIFAVVFYFN